MSALGVRGVDRSIFKWNQKHNWIQRDADISPRPSKSSGSYSLCHTYLHSSSMGLYCSPTLAIWWKTAMREGACAYHVYFFFSLSSCSNSKQYQPGKDLGDHENYCIDTEAHNGEVIFFKAREWTSQDRLAHQIYIYIYLIPSPNYIHIYNWGWGSNQQPRYVLVIFLSFPRPAWLKSGSTSWVEELGIEK